MVGVFGIIVLGVLFLVGCGVVMMVAIAIPVLLVNYFRDRMKTERLSVGAILIIIGIMIIVVGLGIELFKIFIPAVVELFKVNLLIGMFAAVLMSLVIAAPMISLFTYKIDKRIDDLNDMISRSDRNLDFDESHRLLEELKAAEIQYEKRKNMTIDVLIIACMIVFAILYIFSL